MPKVESSMIKEIDYKESEKILLIRFNTGKIYQYLGVEKQIFDDMLKAESVGKFFNQTIKNKFEFKPL